MIDDRYELIRSIGVGSAAEVYSALDTQTQIKVAVKIQNLKGAKNRKLQERFLREARTMMTLKHPNLLSVLDNGITEKERLFLVMPLVGRGTLLSRMSSGPFPTHLQGLSVLVQLLSGMSVVHDAGIVHRDVKLANVLVPTWDGVMLGDFGIARISTEPTLTRADSTLGSAGYMSPEQMDDSRSVGPPADIFSLGVVLFQLMARRGAPDLTLAEEQPELLLPVPRAVRPVVAKATKVFADDRYQTAREMVEDIAKIADGLLIATKREPVGDAWLERFDRLRKG